MHIMVVTNPVSSSNWIHCLKQLCLNSVAPKVLSVRCCMLLHIFQIRNRSTFQLLDYYFSLRSVQNSSCPRLSNLCDSTTVEDSEKKAQECRVISEFVVR